MAVWWRVAGLGRGARALGGVALAGAIVGGVSGAVSAQAPRTAADGVFTTAQAARGQVLYAAQCASCHGAALAGAQGPPLVGDGFLAAWQAQPLSDLAGKIRNTMPLDAPGQLTAQQSADLVAHMLKSGGFPAGGTELSSTDAALRLVRFPVRAAAGQASASAATAGKVYPALGNMAQLMRAIFFPNSNLIFTVQTSDPGAPPPSQSADASQSQGFSWTTWGAGIYGGWQLVDNAAIALADASPLMLVPGIKCENGRVAPITDPDWIRYTEQMIEVARKTYRISQTRNQEAVSDATGDLSDACAACHQAYRDVRIPGRPQGADPNDPSNKAARCMSRSSK
jgi:mono/diheme cytochrome c family protein